jgi:hypothetical protein
VHLEVTMATKRSSTAKAQPAKHPALVSGTPPREPTVQTPEALMAMGDGEMAYLRRFRAGELRGMFPQVADLHPSVELFALFGADGTPLILADTREAVLSGAWDHKLTLASLN